MSTEPGRTPGETSRRAAAASSDARFRSWITADGAPGLSGEGGFPAKAGRQHFYVPLAWPEGPPHPDPACPHELHETIPVSEVDPPMGAEDWVFGDLHGIMSDTVNGATGLYEIYRKNDLGFTDRFTVPVLRDTQRDIIVSNESAEIARMLDRAFGTTGPALNLPDLQPADLAGGNR